MIVTLSSGLEAVMTKMANAGIQHPTDLNKRFLGTAVVFTFSLGDDGETPTVVLSEAGTHKWPYATEPLLTFDDEVLG